MKISGYFMLFSKVFPLLSVSKLDYKTLLTSESQSRTAQCSGTGTSAPKLLIPTVLAKIVKG